MLFFTGSLEEADSESDADWSVSKSLCSSLGVVRPLLTVEQSDPLSLSRLEDSALDGRLVFLTGVLFNGVLSGDEESRGLVPGLTSTGRRSIFGVLGVGGFLLVFLKNTTQKIKMAVYWPCSFLLHSGMSIGVIDAYGLDCKISADI